MLSLFSLLRRADRAIFPGTRVAAPFPCPVCGGTDFERRRVLWNRLAREWELNAAERETVDIQQGLSCLGCRCTLRVMTLASALLFLLRSNQTFAAEIEDAQSGQSELARIQTLELNSAGDLAPFLARLPNHTLGAYPEVDMQAMSYPDESFDLIVHSDTLEHVPDSLAALRECHRVLRTGGAMIYTVPVVFGRPTRSRTGLKDSFHGSILRRSADFLVQREYGTDFMLEPAQAGWESVSMHSLLFPESAALICRKIKRTF